MSNENVDFAAKKSRQPIWGRELIIGTLAGLLGGLAVTAIVSVFPEIIRVVVTPTLPNSAVIAFEGDECPPGWKTYSRAKGRFILGEGALPDGTDLTQAQNQIGGQVAVTLSPDDIPSLAAVVPTSGHDAKGGYDGKINEVVGTGPFPIVATAPVAKQSVRILPPYVALLYCKRT